MLFFFVFRQPKDQETKISSFKLTSPSQVQVSSLQAQESKFNIQSEKSPTPHNLLSEHHQVSILSHVYTTDILSSPQASPVT